MCFRGLFIIDDKGVLRQITMNDLPVGRSVDETLRLVQAFQYTDKHGEGTLISPNRQMKSQKSDIHILADQMILADVILKH